MPATQDRYAVQHNPTHVELVVVKTIFFFELKHQRPHSRRQRRNSNKKSECNQYGNYESVALALVTGFFSVVDAF